MKIKGYEYPAAIGFPSPHSGILFLCPEEKERKRLINAAGFRPLIRGFFFYRYIRNRFKSHIWLVSVPSFGDSFFIKGSEFVVTALDGAFPSPHSGILFLWTPKPLQEPYLA